MANNPNPDFIQEIMYEDHGTRVLITDPSSERFLQEHKRRKLKEKFNDQWFVDENEH